MKRGREMDGFTSKGLIILPPKTIYRKLSAVDKERFENTLQLLPNVFESNYGIKLFYFNTNVIHGVAMPESMQLVNSLCLGDINYLNGIVKEGGLHELICNDKVQFEKDEYENLREKVKKRNPVKKGISVNERMKIIEKRELEIARFIAQKFELIISFEDYKNQRYDFKTKKMDGRILIEIEIPKMNVKGYHSGEVTNIVSLMNREWAYKKVSQWEVVMHDVKK